MGAGALHVAVGQEPHGLRVVQLLARLGGDVAPFGETGEHVLGDGVVVGGAGGGVQLPLDAESLPVGEELGVVAVDDLLGAHPFGVGADGDGGAVDVGAGHHQHPVAPEAVVTGEDVGGQVGAGEMAEMTGPAGVGPGDGDEDVALLGHGVSGYRPRHAPRPTLARGRR